MSEEEAQDVSSMMPSAHSVRKSAHIRGLREVNIHDGTKEGGARDDILAPHKDQSYVFAHLERPYVAVESRQMMIAHLFRPPNEQMTYAARLMIAHGAVV